MCPLKQLVLDTELDLITCQINHHTASLTSGLVARCAERYYARRIAAVTSKLGFLYHILMHKYGQQ